MDLELKYGCNPHQVPARLIYGSEKSPLKILNGNPGFINLLDALNAWQLAKELKTATGKAGAASFKHVSPAGAAVAKSLTGDYLKSQFINDSEYSEVASAYIRARGGDRMSSYGDAAAVSDTVDESLANFLKKEVCDLIIAPSFEPKALEILKSKQKGRFIILEMDENYDPPENEFRQIYGFRMEQKRNNAVITESLFQNIVGKNQNISREEIETLIVATIALKYTQSNSVCVAYDGQVIGMGAGQQSRIHCTRLACSKADKWFLQQHPRILDINFREDVKKTDKTNIVDQLLLWNELSDHEKDNLREKIKGEPVVIEQDEKQNWISKFNGISLSSDAFIPFRDNIDRASRTNIKNIAQAGHALRDEDVTEAADEYGMVMIHTGLRLFTH